MPKILIVANWKENLDKKEAEEWLEGYRKQEVEGKKQAIEVVICPPFPLIPLVLGYSKGLGLATGAQTISHFEKGAYTGEVSAEQLKSLGVKYVIVGHSELREHFGETNKQINQKIKLCLKYGLIPIVCVSEFNQIEAVRFSNFQPPGSNLKPPTSNLIIAYEPLFAIGSGQPDTPANAQKMALAIKKILGENVWVLYGGSVNSQNATSFLQEKDIHGLLIGGASLNPIEFSQIIQATYELH